MKIVKIDLGKELTHIKSFTDIKKQVKYINTSFRGGQTKEYTIKFNDKNIFKEFGESNDKPTKVTR